MDCLTGDGQKLYDLRDALRLYEDGAASASAIRFAIPRLFALTSYRPLSRFDEQRETDGRNEATYQVVLALPRCLSQYENQPSCEGAVTGPSVQQCDTNVAARPNSPDFPREGGQVVIEQEG